MVRCFIAIDLPENIKAKFFHEIKILEKSNFAYGKFVEKENLHLTIKFLGELTEEEIKKIKLKLKQIKQKSFELQLTRIGFFPSDKYIKILWIGLGDLSEDNLLKKLFEKINEKTKEINLDYEEFNPHITLARIKGIKNKKEFTEKVNNLRVPQENFVVEGFSLMKSELFHKGVKYKTIEKFTFS